MDKKTAFKILNLETTISFEEAKKAYRNLAKKYHPDVVEKEFGSKSHAEAKMKEINLAFRYLGPHLKSNEPVKKIRKEKKSITPEKMGTIAFFLKIFGLLLTAFRGKKDSRFFENKYKKEKPLRKTRDRKVRFGDVFKSVYKLSPDREGEAEKIIKRNHSQKNSPYYRYQKYMALKRKINSGLSKSNQDMSIGRIDKIDPVKPVKPVKRS
ncbi:MAG: J domain-containing protein [Desulfobacula sp.]|uniref:J domain-containing protein n=1 Tax=Desulfobacula sp. TaxID=2593537 RepID=UPI0025C17DB5|nr:J domain-containing protein [Desulfobacula sp.]MCD4722310.1 J domain-containing protein [Desulfobacula sp.]